MKNVINTGEYGDPAQLYANAHQAKADAIGEEVYAAKTTLLRLPRLASPPGYVTARATAVLLQADALLTPSNQAAFIAAVDAAVAAYLAIP